MPTQTTCLSLVKAVLFLIKYLLSGHQIMLLYSAKSVCDLFLFLFLFFGHVFLSHVKNPNLTTQGEVEQILHGIHSITVEGGDATTPPADVGIVIEGVEVLHDLGDIATACALLMGVIYALNLSYPQELKAFFEVLQKIFLHLDASRLSIKVQMLKNKLFE